MKRVMMLAILAIGTAHAEFTATYTPLANSPQGTQTSWYSGAVTNDGKFVYGLGHSHNSNGNNSIYLYDPATNTHRQLQPNTGGKWIWTNGSDGKPLSNTGRWATLTATDPLYAYFGGQIKAITNRNNHQAFYMPARNEFWVLAGTTFYQGGGHFAGRFDMATERWGFASALSPTDGLAGFSAGLIAGSGGWVAPNAATAVCKDLNTVVLFGGMNSTGGVRIIEPNPVGPEPYRWASAPKPPIYLPAENVRHTAVCAGDTVYFSSAQERVSGTPCCRTPNPGPFWKFHVPTRTWTRLTDGPPGGYFPTLTHDSEANALLYYGGGTGQGSKALWAYDLTDGTWQNLTGTTAAPQVDMFTAGFVPGFGHIYKGGRKWDGTKMAGAGTTLFKIALTRVEPPPPPEPTPEPEPVTGFMWNKIPLVGGGLSPTGSQKHQRLVEGPDGRVYTLGGDWGGLWGNNTGRQEVYSFDPGSPTGDWKLEAPYCGTVASPVHWHTDEAGVAWDATRGVFWKLAGTVYGPDDACFLAGKSVKAKVIQFDPATKRWTVPTGFVQKNIGYVTNGVLDPDHDEMIQITDTVAWHLGLTTGQWTSYPLPGDVKRFSALTTRIGREVWFGNQKQFIESYNLDTHKLTNHGYPPWPTSLGYGTFMTANVGGKLLVVKGTAGPDEPRHAGLYDPATEKWTTLDQGEGWGNTALWHSSGRLILMGGGIQGPAYHNKFVWVGALG